jgi:hypothetical protein
MLEAMRTRKIAQLERQRKSRVILLVQQAETMRLLGFPLVRYIDINDSEDLLRAIQMTDDSIPAATSSFTRPVASVLAALQIARAITNTRQRLRSSCRTTQCQAARSSRLRPTRSSMSQARGAGPIDPQIGQQPAASLIRVVEQIADFRDR